MRVQRCKGTRDLSPEEMNRFRLIEGIFRDSCLKGGYQEVRTPTLEYLHLFTSTGTLTPGTLGRVYSFLDWDGWSGERVVIRPDGTIPIARLYIDTMTDKDLARLFYVTNIFIFEETGKETREKWQCGVELIGANSTIADVELITLSLEILKSLGLENVELKLSHAGVIRALLAGFGLSPEEQTAVFDQILDGDTAVLTRLKTQAPELGQALTPLLDLQGQAPGFLRNLRSLFNQDLPGFESSLDNFIGIVDTLDALGYSYQVDIASGKGFEYYTGVIFHLSAGDEVVGGGGRYDALIPLMGGKDTPASGFALYLDPLMNLVKPRMLTPNPVKKILVRTESRQPKAVKEVFSIAGRLREAGYVAELSIGSQQPADFRWTLDIQSKAPGFTLTDNTGNKKFEAQNADEVLELLGK